MRRSVNRLNLKSRAYLFKKFRQELKSTIGAYITECKLRESRSLLQYTDKSLGKISSYLCFSSQSYFQNVFKKYNGVTPLEYRRIHAHNYWIANKRIPPVQRNISALRTLINLYSSAGSINLPFCMVASEIFGRGWVLDEWQKEFPTLWKLSVIPQHTHPPQLNDSFFHDSSQNSYRQQAASRRSIPTWTLSVTQGMTLYCMILHLPPQEGAADLPSMGQGFPLIRILQFPPKRSETIMLVSGGFWRTFSAAAKCLPMPLRQNRNPEAGGCSSAPCLQHSWASSAHSRRTGCCITPEAAGCSIYHCSCIVSDGTLRPVRNWRKITCAEDAG